MALPPVAFLSYVHSDDRYGHITEFCGRLAAEVQAQLGEEFRIFQDRNDISWGQHWRERIDEGVDAATFLVPVITPSYFNSDYCRGELERFLKHERKLKRKDLVLPVYYIDAPLLDEERRKDDKLAIAIASRQMADWRDLRFEPYTSPQVGKRLADLAVQVRVALDRTAGGAPAAPPRRAPSRRRPAATPTEDTTAQEAAPEVGTGRAPSAKTEPTTVVVSQLHRGDYTSISAAIADADPGTRTLVQPGRYEEGLLISKPLEIVGGGNRDDIVVQATKANAILFRATMGKVTNLTLRQAGGGNWFAVDIAQGRLDLEDCDISSESLSCVAVHGGADPRLRRNRIHDGRKGGVLVCENALGVLEDNDILGNANAGVVIKQGGNPTLRRNRVHDNRQSGVFVCENAFGVLEDNDILGSALSGVEIRDGSNPTLRRNRIHDGKQSGVFVHTNALGVLEDNDIFGNAFSGVEIRDGGNPTLRRNRIHDGKQAGISVHTDGLGALEDNDILANGAGIVVRGGGNPTARQNRINANRLQGVWASGGGAGTYEGNDLRDNAKGPWLISEDSLPNVKRSGNIEE